jgi:L-methionine (R)-S-oxide reductase
MRPDEDAALERIVAILKMRAPAERAAELICGVIREAGNYRWVGLYGVGPKAVAILGWSGPRAPTHPRFPVDQGLCSAAVAIARPVVVGDASRDPRYLTTFGSTRSELVVPVLETDSERVVGLIDVESEQLNAFDDEDVQFIARCADAARAVWSA